MHVENNTFLSTRDFDRYIVIKDLEPYNNVIKKPKPFLNYSYGVKKKHFYKFLKRAADGEKMP